LNLRKAYKNESKELNLIAYDSEGIWGEDEQYMIMFSREYKVTEAMIRDEHVYVLEDRDKIIGFFAIIKREGVSELELFYVHKEHIGKGYGSILWQEMITVCKVHQINRIELVASNDVAEFYRRIGAKEVTKMKSTLQEGRIVTKFEYKIRS